MKSIEFESPRYEVVSIFRKSKARYAVGIVPGDVLHFTTSVGRTTRASSGNYALDISVYVNGEYKAVCSQNEVLAIFESDDRGRFGAPIFELKKIQA